MKTLNILMLGCLFSLITACNDDKDRDNGDTGYKDTEREQVPDRGADWGAERDEYRVRLNTRLQEIETDIEEERNEMQAEKDARKRSDYEGRIEKKESFRNNLKEKMNRLEEETEEGWAKFKAEVNDLFDRDDWKDRD